MEYWAYAFSICAVVFASCTLLFGIYSIVKSTQLSLYVKRNRSSRWMEIASIGEPPKKMGAGGIDSIKSIRYIYSNDDNDDKKIEQLKKSVRCSIKLIGISLIATIISIGMIVVSSL